MQPGCVWGAGGGMGWCQNWPHPRGKERWRREAYHSRWVGGRFNKQGTYILRDRRPPHLPARILAVYVEASVKWFRSQQHSHVLLRLSPDGLNNTFLSGGLAFETAPSMGTVGGIYIPRTGEELSIEPKFSSQVNYWPALSMTCSNSG